MNDSTMDRLHIEPGQDSGQPGETEVITAKVAAMVVLGVTSLVMGNVPALLTKCFKSSGQYGDGGIVKQSSRMRFILSFLLAFGGGALLCTTFLHLLPEVRESIEALQSNGSIGKTEFPLTEVIMCCGLFLMYMIEDLVHLYLHTRHGKNKHDDTLHRTLSIRKCSQSDERNNNPCASNGSTVTEAPKKTNNNNSCDRKENGHSISMGHSHFTHDEDEEDSIVSSVRGLLIVLALSIHELFEGLAVGLESSTQHVWYMLGAVAAHKLVISFCVGIELVSSKVKTWLSVLYISTFALVTPLGIGVGIALTRDSTEDVAGGVTNTVLQGLATGTLLYVVFFEILQKQRIAGNNDLRQLLPIMIGFGVMFGLLVAVGHEHSHGHGHTHDDDHEHHVEETATDITNMITQAISDAVKYSVGDHASNHDGHNHEHDHNHH